jgi:integrase
MAEAAELKSFTGMKALNLETLIGLLAATGLRPGEAAALESYPARC